MHDNTEVRIPVSPGKLRELARALLPPGSMRDIPDELAVHYGDVTLVFVSPDPVSRPIPQWLAYMRGAGYA